MKSQFEVFLRLKPTNGYTIYHNKVKILCNINYNKIKDYNYYYLDMLNLD